MKKAFFIILYLFTFLLCFSQKNNFKITYRHCTVNDTLQKIKDTIGFEAILIGNSSESNYNFARPPLQIPTDLRIKEKEVNLNQYQSLINNKQSISKRLI